MRNTNETLEGIKIGPHEKKHRISNKIDKINAYHICQQFSHTWPKTKRFWSTVIPNIKNVVKQAFQ